MSDESPAPRAIQRSVGRRIREWRLRREMSQTHLARCVGIGQASLSNYENGKRDMPLSTLADVASVLNVSIGDLLDVPETIVVRASILGRAVEELQHSHTMEEPSARPVLALVVDGGDREP